LNTLHIELDTGTQRDQPVSLWTSRLPQRRQKWQIKALATPRCSGPETNDARGTQMDACNLTLDGRSGEEFDCAQAIDSLPAVKHAINDDPREKRNIGKLWEEKSGKRGLFLIAEKADSKGRNTRAQLEARTGK